MSFTFALSVAVVAIFLTVYVKVARRLWRGEAGLEGVPEGIPGWWPFGGLAWAGLGRSYVAAGPFLVLFLGAGAADLATPETSTPLALLSTAGLLGAVGVVAAIVLANRPSALVPPHRRDEPGVLSGPRP